MSQPLAALTWPGSKTPTGSSHGAGSEILRLLPTDAATYCEPFAGMLGLLLNRPVATMEIVNDLDGEIINWWRVLRDQTDELIGVLMLTPHSRQELAECGEPCEDPVERARRFTVRCTQALPSGQWRRGVSPNRAHSSWETLTNKLLDGRLVAIAERIRNVQIEHIDALPLIERVGAEEEALLYVDPPYREVGDSLYSHTVDHDELAQLLLTSKARVAVSGYPGGVSDAGRSRLAPS